MPSDLFLYNTLTRQKERFTPRKAENIVKMFTCGPSIYNWPHIGNFRTFLFEDILQRYLEYKGYTVERMINFTDIEDKSIHQANKDGVALEALTQPVARSFMEDCARLKISLPETIPRSSTSIEQAVYLTEQLLDKGFAYRHGGDIFYDPLKFKDFGKLYGLDMSRWPKQRTRFYKDTYPGKRWNRGDFILWKARRKEDGNIFWQTSLGEGRPAWNIQDPAMLTQHLGYEIDIWCGGIDNLYRHHDYNIAVTEGVSGKTLSRFWLHCEHVLIRKTKMSKSKGNILYVKDLLNTGYHPRHIRFFLIYTHFQQHIDVNNEHLQLARGKIDTLRDMLVLLENGNAAVKNTPAAQILIKEIQSAFERRMNDNLDVKGAFDDVFDNTRQLAKMKATGTLGSEQCRAAVEQLKQIDRVWQVLG